MEFRDVINDLIDNPEKTGLYGMTSKYWPKYAFHFTDIENAINILKNGEIHSRYHLEHDEKNINDMKNDNANSGVIDQTKTEVEKMIRFYFRPRTPTQYYNEGMKTKEEIENQAFKANCPVPVFFLFDLAGLLKRPGVKFTDCSLALRKEPHYMNTPEEFAKLPFKKIYFNHSMRADMSPKEKKELTDIKQSEIVAEDPVKLDLLRHVYVRSAAEKETLINLLHDNGMYNLDSKISIASRATFFKDRNYVKNVTLKSNEYIIHNNIENDDKSQQSQPYPLADWHDARFAVNPDETDKFLDVQLRIIQNGQEFVWPKKGQKALLKEQMKAKISPAESYVFKIYIDDHIAYEGKYNIKDDRPY